MINVKNFDNSLNQGEDFEKEVLTLIQKKYKRAYRHSTPYHDIVIPEIKSDIECKEDLTSERTNNFFVEYTFNGNSSGIDRTTSKYWIFGDLERVYIVKTKDLKELSDKYELGDFIGWDCIVQGVKVPKIDFMQLNMSILKRLKDYEALAEEYSPLTASDLKYTDLAVLNIV